MNSIANRVKNVRKAASLTQDEFAKKIGVSSGAVANWETGYSSPRQSTWERFKAFEKQYWETKDVSRIAPVVTPKMRVRLRRLRKELGLSQKAFADLMGVSIAAVGNWEVNKYTPGKEHMQRIEELEASVKNEDKVVEKPEEANVSVDVVETEPKQTEQKDEAIEDMPMLTLDEDDILLFEDIASNEGQDETPATDTLKDQLASLTDENTESFTRSLDEYGHVAGLMKLDEHLDTLKKLNKVSASRVEVREQLLRLMADAWRTVESLDVDEGGLS